INSEIFVSRYQSVLTKIQQETKSDIYCVTTWWATKVVDKIIYKMCTGNSIYIVDISGISSVAGARADTNGKFNNLGVASHPSDTGMQLIATKIFENINFSNDKKNN
ncbi:MAG: hypothetical protein Q7T74_05530, partial [Candidatus Saccharibacteria bacterium]|nr:hypothetical protein [Candidatus Saccharibacteria bacterium]